MNYSKEEITLINEAEKVSELPDTIGDAMDVMNETSIPIANKDAVDHQSLRHRNFLKGPFWQKIPAFSKVTVEEFMDTKFQNKNTVKKVAELRTILEGLVDEKFLEDVENGMAEAPMNIRLSPYILSLIDWSDPYNDPLRIQFLPVSLTKIADHPKLTLDSLHEQDDSPVSGLVHRYHDKALFLPLDVCPVYCRFCTRSYAIGSDTDSVSKVNFKPIPKNWYGAFAYIASRPEIEDVVISGGDAYMLVPDRIRQIGETLLEIPHIRRIRFATKGPAVMPMKILTETAW